MPLFSKKGRLKCGFQKLRLCPGVVPDLTWPSSTPGKVPVAARGPHGRLDQKLKQLARGELPRCSWLDRKVLKAVADRQLAEPQARCPVALSAITYVEGGPVLRAVPLCRCCAEAPALDHLWSLNAAQLQPVCCPPSIPDHVVSGIPHRRVAARIRLAGRPRPRSVPWT